MNWLELAACRGADPDLFFPPIIEPHTAAKREVREAEEKRVAMAKAYCDICPVSDQCLSEALVRGEKSGVWGGVDLSSIKRARDLASKDKRQGGLLRVRRDHEARRAAVQADVVKINEHRRRHNVDVADREGTA